jgi:hypothetical protein
MKGTIFNAMPATGMCFYVAFTVMLSRDRKFFRAWLAMLGKAVSAFVRLAHQLALSAL